MDRVGSVISEIADDPLGFANNLASAIGGGFQRFFDNFTTHILGGFFDWLFAGLGAVGVNLPRDFSPRSLVTFFLELMGITWQLVRRLLVRLIGERNVAVIEQAFEIVSQLIALGPSGLFQLIEEQLDPRNPIRQVIDATIAFLTETLIGRVAARIIALFNPAGAIIQAIELIYRVLDWVFSNAARIFSLVETIVGGAAALIAGNIGGIAAAIETALARLIGPVIDFLAGFLGLGALPDRIADTIRGFQEWIMRIIERVIRALAERASSLIARISGARQRATSVEGESGTEETDLYTRVQRTLLEQLGAQDRARGEVAPIVSELAERLRRDGVRRLVLTDEAEDGSYDILIEASPLRPLANMVPKWRRASMRCAARIVLAGPSVMWEELEGVAAPATAIDPHTGERTPLEPFGFSRPPSGRWQTRAGTAVRSMAGEVQTVSKATGDYARIAAGSHAERYLVDFIENQRAWHQRIVSIEIENFPLSPCSHCGGALIELLHDLNRGRSSNSDQGKLTWSVPWTQEPIATIEDTLARMRRGGWTVEPGRVDPEAYAAAQRKAEAKAARRGR